MINKKSILETLKGERDIKIKNKNFSVELDRFAISVNSRILLNNIEIKNRVYSFLGNQNFNKNIFDFQI